MNDNIKISVITPMYNSAKYLDDFITKFLNQTLNNIELILVNDASPDNSFEIASNYQKNYPNIIKVLSYDTNRRAGGARNYGLLHAKGQFVAFIDPDDWMDDSMLEKLYNKAVKDSCDIVDCDYYDYNSSTGELIPQVSYKDNCIGDVDDRLLNNTILYSGRIFTKIYSRKMLVDNGLMYPENIMYEDNGTILHICAKKIGKVKENLFFYRTFNTSSQTGSICKDSQIHDRITAARHFVDCAIKFKKLDALFESIEFRYIYLGLASNIYLYVVNKLNINFKELERANEYRDKYFSRYKDNIYYKHNLPPYNLPIKFFMRVYEINPYLLLIVKFIKPVLHFFYKIYKLLKYENRNFKSGENSI